MYTSHGAQIISAIKARQEANPIPDTELIQCIWQGLMASVDWSARPDQIEGLALREVGVSSRIFSLIWTTHPLSRRQKYAPILEPFCDGPKTEVALINVVQVYCYEDTRIIKAFPQILKVR